MLKQTNENTGCGHDPHWLYPVAPYDAQCLLCDIQEIQNERDSLKAENTRLTAYDGGLALMPFEEWQTLSAETRARLNAYGLQMENLQKELVFCHIVLQRLVAWYDGPPNKDELFLAIDDARLALGQELT